MSLKDIKVGEKIKCLRHFSRTDFVVYTVVRLTKTQAICEPTATFRLDSGLMVGTGEFRNRRYGSIATQADFDERDLCIRLRDAQHAIHYFRVTTANLEAVEALLRASKP